VRSEFARLRDVPDVARPATADDGSGTCAAPSERDRVRAVDRDERIVRRLDAVARDEQEFLLCRIAVGDGLDDLQRA
jgi:hypothetical protein